MYLRHLSFVQNSGSKNVAIIVIIVHNGTTATHYINVKLTSYGDCAAFVGVPASAFDFSKLIPEGIRVKDYLLV